MRKGLQELLMVPTTDSPMLPPDSLLSPKPSAAHPGLFPEHSCRHSPFWECCFPLACCWHLSRASRALRQATGITREQQEQLWVLGQTSKNTRRNPNFTWSPPGHFVCSKASPCFVSWLLNHPLDKLALGKRGCLDVGCPAETSWAAHPSPGAAF